MPNIQHTEMFFLVIIGQEIRPKIVHPQIAFLCTVEPHYLGHPWDWPKMTLMGR